LRAGDATAERLPACPALFSWRISAFGWLSAEADNLRRAWVAFLFGASYLPRAERATNLATDATPESPKALCSKSARWLPAGIASCLRLPVRFRKLSDVPSVPSSAALPVFRSAAPPWPAPLPLLVAAPACWPRFSGRNLFHSGCACAVLPAPKHLPNFLP
jgi:hypothetical protein